LTCLARGEPSRTAVEHPGASPDSWRGRARHPAVGAGYLAACIE
jgi:hypothetical protein